MIPKSLVQSNGADKGGKPEGTKDCVACRLISGCGLLGIGAYILAHSKNPRILENLTLKGLAAVAAGLGVARLANADFMRALKGDDE